MKDIIETISLFNRIGETTTPNDILETENKVIKLVEERGVASFPYRKVVDEIFEYIKDYAVSLKNEETTVTFDIPENITKKIDFINILSIKVTLNNCLDISKTMNHGAGTSQFSISQRLINDKLSFGNITLTCFAHKGYLIGRTVYGCTYHELNHYWEAYCDLKQNGYYKRYYNQAYKSSESSNNAIDIFSNKTLNDLFNNILYRLFSETEFNALVSSVYGDLEAIYSKREDFKEDIKKTAAYVLYNAFSKNYKALYSYIDENNITKIKNLFNNLGITLNPYSNSVESFRKELTRKTNFLLKQLIKGIGRTASLYYDTMEEEISDNITIN